MRYTSVYAGLLGLLAAAYFLPSIPASLVGQPWAGSILSAQLYNLYYIVVPLLLVSASIWLLVMRRSKPATLAVLLMLILTLVPVIVRSTVIGVQGETFPKGLLRLPFLVFFAASLASIWFTWQAYSSVKERHSQVLLPSRRS